MPTSPPLPGLVQPGEAEGFKAGVHLGLFGLAVACLGYNVMAWGERRQSHLLRNVVVYGALAVYEGYQIKRHCDNRR